MSEEQEILLGVRDGICRGRVDLDDCERTEIMKYRPKREREFSTRESTETLLTGLNMERE